MGGAAFAFALPPIMPSFVGFFALGGDAIGGACFSGCMGACLGSGVVSGGGEGARSGSGSGTFFLPPITPSPFLGFFGGSFSGVSGTAGFGGGEAVGVCPRRGGGESSGSGSASDSVAVASFVCTAWACGDRLFFLRFGLGGDIADFVSRTLCRGTTSCCCKFSEIGHSFAGENSFLNKPQTRRCRFLTLSRRHLDPHRPVSPWA